jgi:Mg/Co/Ni transporter MgtE
VYFFVFLASQDKAALLANMQPDAVARLLALMDPNEAVLLLAALGDGNSQLVSQALSLEDRDKMIEVGDWSNMLDRLLS